MSFEDRKKVWHRTDFRVVVELDPTDDFKKANITAKNTCILEVENMIDEITRDVN